MPLHYFGVPDTCHVTVVKTTLMLLLENQKGQRAPVLIHRDATVGDLKQRIVGLTSVSSTQDISLFVRPHLSFTKLWADSAKLGDITPDRSCILVLENRFCSPCVDVEVTPELGDSSFYWQSRGLLNHVWGVESGDTVLSVKLRAQDQLGVDASRAQVHARPLKQSWLFGTPIPDDSKQWERGFEHQIILPAAAYRLVTNSKQGFSFLPSGINLKPGALFMKGATTDAPSVIPAGRGRAGVPPGFLNPGGS